MKIAVQATFSKLTSTVDGGLRISFDLPSDAIKEAGDIMAMQHESLMLVVMREDEFKELENDSEEIDA